MGARTSGDTEARENAGAGPGGTEPVRLDKWLWAARFFKTRALAAAAIGGGRVEVNGARAKHARAVRPGDLVRLRLGPFEYLLTVRRSTAHRGPASEAALLYDEDPAGQARRAHLAEQHRLAAQAFRFGEGKPSKQERRALLRLKRGE